MVWTLEGFGAPIWVDHMVDVEWHEGTCENRIGSTCHDVGTCVPRLIGFTRWGRAVFSLGSVVDIPGGRVSNVDIDTRI